MIYPKGISKAHDIASLIREHQRQELVKRLEELRKEVQEIYKNLADKNENIEALEIALGIRQ